MKKIIVLGNGVQGSTVVRRLCEEPNVSEVICADYNLEVSKRLEKMLKKARAVRVDGSKIEEILSAAKGAGLIVNALPPEFNPVVMEAALQGKMNYQDLASGPVKGVDFVETVKRQLALDKRFKEVGLSALINAGSAPGITNLLARNAYDKLDTCERIQVLLFESVWTKKFIPFWWSPATAFGDMAAKPIVFENAKFKKVKPFNDPVMFDFKGLGIRRMVDHEHEEPVTFGLTLKGLKYAVLKMGGPAIELSESFYKMGLLGKETVEVGGIKVVPLDLILKLTPPAPSSPEEIKEAIDGGIEIEEGAALIRVEGIKDGQQVRYDNYISAPGLVESFERYQITHEAFLTGQAAFLFAKLFVHDKITNKGVAVPESLGSDIRSFYFNEAAKLGIIAEEVVETRL